MMPSLTLTGGLLLARIFLVALFPVSAVDKIVHWELALKQANSSLIANGAPMLLVAIAIELIAPFCIVVGWHGQLAAFVLAGFCAVTALLYHSFWQFRHFWSGEGKEGATGRAHFWDFLKNFGLIGGLLLLALTLDVPATDNRVPQHQLSSAPQVSQPPRSVGPSPRSCPAPCPTNR